MAFSMISSTATSLTSLPTTFSTAASLVARSEEAAQALTTPYVYPAECDPVWNMTSKAQNTYFDAIIRETFLFQERHASAYLSCQPSGLTLPHYTYGPFASVYQGAVCPQGWMAHQVGMTSNTFEKNTGWNGPRTWNTAICCRSGDWIETDIWSVLDGPRGDWGGSSVCVKTSYDYDSTTALFLATGQYVTTSVKMRTRTDTIIEREYFTDERSPVPTNTYTTTQTTVDYQGDYMDVKVPFNGGRMFYPPWSIEWTNEDNATLDPKWPTMTNDMLIRTWVPGDKIYDSYENKGTGPTPPQPAVTKNKVMIPILAVLGTVILALIIVIGCMWRRHQKAMKNKGNVETAELLETAKGASFYAPKAINKDAIESLPSNGDQVSGYRPN